MFEQTTISTLDLNEELIFIENETILQNPFSYSIPFNSQEELLEKIENNKYFEVLKLIQTFQINEIKNDSKILILNENLNDYLKICIQNEQDILCRLQIDKTFINGKMKISEIHQQFSLPHRSCSNIQLVKNEKIIILCNVIQGSSHLILTSYDGNVYDSIEFFLSYHCLQQYMIFENIILLYNIECQNYQIRIIYFDEEANNLKKKQDEFVFEYSAYQNLGFLIKAEFCSKNQVFLNFERAIIIQSIDSPNVIQVFNFLSNIMVFQQYCNIEFVLGFQGPENQLFDNITTITPNFLIKFNFNETKKLDFVNKNVVIQIKDQIVVMNNEDINSTLNGVIDYLSLLKLPIIITIFNNKTLSIFQVNQVSQLLTFKETKYLAFLKQKNFRVGKNDFDIRITKKVNSTNVFEINNLENNTKDFNFIEISGLLVSSLYEYIPFVITNYECQDNVISIATEYLYDSICYLKFNQSNKIKVIKIIRLNNNNCFSILFQIQNKSNSSQYLNYIQNCCKNKTQLINFIAKSNQDQLLYYKKNSILLVEKSSVLHIQLSDTFQIVNQSKIIFGEEIVNIWDSDYSFVISLADDTSYEIYFQRYQFFSKLTNLNQSRIQEKNHNSQSEIIIKKNNSQYFDIIANLDCVIINQHHFISSNRYLVVCLNKDNSISVNIYYYTNIQIQFLYQTPLYNFTIVLPLQICYSEFHYAFLAKKEELKGVLFLIYKVNQINALKSLQAIKRIGNISDINYLSLEPQKNICFCGQQICVLSKYDSDILLIHFSNSFDEFNRSDLINLTVQSFILNFTKQKQLTISYLNFDKKLRFKFQINNKNQFLFVNEKNYLYGFQKIFGPIQNISFVQKCNATLINPVEKIGNQSITCVNIFGLFCQQSIKKLIYDPFGNSMIIDLPFDVKIKFIKYIIEVNSLLKIYYENFYHKLLLLIIENWKSMNSKDRKFEIVNFDFSFEITEWELTVNENLLYLQKYPYIMILDNQKNNKPHLKELSGEIQSMVVYFENYPDDGWRIVRIYKSQEMCLYIHEIQFHNENITSTEGKELKLSQNTSDFQLYEVRRNLQILSVTLILYQHQSSPYSHRQMISLQIQFNLENQNVIEEKVKQYIRIEERSLEKFQIIGKTLLAFISLNGNILLLYNLSDESQNQNFIDYYFSTCFQNNIIIQNYNDTFQLLIDRSKQQIIHLIDIQAYKLYFKDQQSECLIELNNEISSLQVFVKKYAMKNAFFYIETILTLNCIFIVFIQQKFQKKKLQMSHTKVIK